MRVGETRNLQVATGVDPRHALVAAVDSVTHGEPYGLYLQAKHDDGCPCLDGRPMHACTCEIVGLVIRRVL